jgi:radical SAM superfamily enzyme YgiQ (UPF0313 family)
VTVVFGGVHVSALRSKILESYPAIDFLVTGEGEKAMAELARGAKPGTIQGLVYREGTGILDNGLRTDLCELDSLPFPAYHKLDGFRKIARVVQLPEGAVSDDYFEPRLSLPVFVLRPLGVPQELSIQLG